MEEELTKKRMWSKKVGNELYVFHNGAVIYKRWLNKNGGKRQPSILIGKNGWPNEWIT